MLQLTVWYMYQQFLPFVWSWICLSLPPLHHLHVLYHHLVINCFHKHCTLVLFIFMQSGEEEKREHDDWTEPFNCIWANAHAISWRGFCGYSQWYESTKTCHWNPDFFAGHSLWKFMMNASVFVLSWINNSCPDFCSKPRVINEPQIPKCLFYIVTLRFFIGNFRKSMVNSYNIFIFLLFFWTYKCTLYIIFSVLVAFNNSKAILDLFYMQNVFQHRKLH